MFFLCEGGWVVTGHSRLQGRIYKVQHATDYVSTQKNISSVHDLSEVYSNYVQNIKPFALATGVWNYANMMQVAWIPVSY